MITRWRRPAIVGPKMAFLSDLGRKGRNRLLQSDRKSSHNISMTRILTFLSACVIFASVANAADPQMKVTLTKDKTGGTPATTFDPTVETVFALFKGENLHAGDKLRGVWIAEDVGDAAPPGTKIDEKTVDSPGESATGNFSLSKPDKGWPVGKYKLDVYVNDKLVTTEKFSVAGAGKPNSEVASQPAAAEVPDKDELRSLVNDSMDSFGDALNDKDFSGFYLDIASVWQQQTSAEKLSEAFKDFYGKDIDISAAIQDKDPVFDKPAAIRPDGVLVVQGHYATKPNRIVFILKYVNEEEDWKLVGIDVNTKE